MLAEMSKVSKHYGRREAVHEVSLAVNPGEEIDVLLNFPQELELESFLARLGEVDLRLGLLAGQSRIEMARGGLTLSTDEETGGSVVARI